MSSVPTTTWAPATTCACLTQVSYTIQAEIGGSTVRCFDMLAQLASFCDFPQRSICMSRSNFQRSFKIQFGCLDTDQTAAECRDCLLTLSDPQLTVLGLIPGTVELVIPEVPAAASPLSMALVLPCLIIALFFC